MLVDRAEELRRRRPVALGFEGVAISCSSIGSFDPMGGVFDPTVLGVVAEMRVTGTSGRGQTA